MNDPLKPGIIQRVRNLFKSKAQKRMERDLAVRRALTLLKKQIGALKENEAGYLQKARESIKLQSPQQLQFLKRTLGKTLAQRRLLERELLHIQTMQQLDGQMRSHVEFVTAMNSMSDNLAESFKDTDLSALQSRMQKAMIRAEGVSQQMDYIMDVLSETMYGIDETFDNQLVKEEEIDRLIAGAPLEEKRQLKKPVDTEQPRTGAAAQESIDDKMLNLIRQIERELQKEK